MKITQLGRTRPLLSVTGMLSGGGSVGGEGTVPTSNGSNGVSWASNIQLITADASNKLRGPFINFASGSNVVFTFDGMVGSTPSNTLRIHSTGGSGSLSISANYVGYNSVGASNEAPGNLHVLATSFTTTTQVILQNVAIHAKENGGNVTNLMVGLWANNAGAFGKLLAVSTTGTTDSVARDATYGWIAVPITEVLAAATTYWIGVMFDGGVDIKYDTGGSDRTVTSGGWWLPDGSIYSQTDTTKRYSIRGLTIG